MFKRNRLDQILKVDLSFIDEMTTPTLVPVSVGELRLNRCMFITSVQ